MAHSKRAEGALWDSPSRFRIRACSERLHERIQIGADRVSRLCGCRIFAGGVLPVEPVMGEFGDSGLGLAESPILEVPSRRRGQRERSQSSKSLLVFAIWARSGRFSIVIYLCYSET